MNKLYNELLFDIISKTIEFYIKDNRLYPSFDAARKLYILGGDYKNTMRLYSLTYQFIIDEIKKRYPYYNMVDLSVYLSKKEILDFLCYLQKLSKLMVFI
jgi:hypothetical protein